MKKKKDIIKAEYIGVKEAYDLGFASYPSGECPYKGSSGLSNERYSFYMGFYDKKFEHYRDWPEYESNSKLTVDLTNRFGKKNTEDVKFNDDGDCEDGVEV